jgi:uncharacterized protein (TIGR02466 family)
MPTPEKPHAAALEQVRALLAGNRPGEAADACRRVLDGSPGSIEALHLLALAYRRLGNSGEAEKLLRRCLSSAPRSPELHANLANLLVSDGRTEEAERAYRTALAISADFRPARLGLARALNARGVGEAAEKETRRLIDANRDDAEAWAELGVALRGQDKSIAAEAAYRRALDIRPQYGVARHNLGALLAHLRRAEEALEQLDMAAAHGAHGQELHYNRGRVLLELYRLEEAEQALVQAVKLAPMDARSHSLLARLRHMRGDSAFDRDLKIASERHPDRVDLQVTHANLLCNAGLSSRAEEVLAAALRRHGERPELLSSLASLLQELGRPSDALGPALLALRGHPADGATVSLAVSVLLSLGRAQEAMPLIEKAREREPLDQTHLAMQATALRLLGDPRYQQLYDYDGLVRTYDLDPPAGWTSKPEFSHALLSAVEDRHRFKAHPLNQSVRSGTQTAHSLLVDPDPTIRDFLQSLNEPLRDYLSQLGSDRTHPMRSRNTGRFALAGCWSVRLQRGGFHVNHVHPQGWISSAYYVSTPGEAADLEARNGWLKFGEPRFPTPGATPERFVQPQPGRLVLFPSYMWHGTTPLTADEARVSIAFDATTA